MNEVKAPLKANNAVPALRRELLLCASEKREMLLVQVKRF